MPLTQQELLAEALQLPVELRTALADCLYESVEAEMGPPDEIEQAWLEEAERRVQRLDRGETELIPHEVVVQQIEAMLKH